MERTNGEPVASDPVPHHSEGRELAYNYALVRARLTERGDDPPFDRLTTLAARSTSASMTTLAAITEQAHLVKSASGRWPTWADAWELPLSASICRYVVSSAQPLVIPDTRGDAKLAGNEAVTQLGVGAYLGVPVRVDGLVVAVFAAMDTRPHEWTNADREALEDIAAVAAREIQFRLATVQPAMQPAFRSLINLLPVGVYATDAEGRIAYSNQRMATLWGREPFAGALEPAMFERRRLRLPDGTLVGEAATPLQLALRNGQPTANLELGLAEQTVLVSAEPILENSRVLGAVCVVHDVTDIRQVSRLRDELLALVSHELRTPLTIINGMASMLSRRWETLQPGDRDEALEHLTVAGKRMERAVENMLILSHIEHEAAEPEPLPVAVVVDLAVARHREHFPWSRVELALPADLPLVIAVRAWLDAILVNLLNNAEQYGDSDEPHLLAITPGEQSVTFTLRNSGPPLAPDEYAAIFEPFYRHPSAATEVPGAGLGLAVTRRLAEMMGGHITAEARPDGHGTEVTLVLPASTSE